MLIKVDITNSFRVINERMAMACVFHVHYAATKGDCSITKASDPCVRAVNALA